MDQKVVLIYIQAILIFVALNAFYWLLFKWLAWRGSFMQPVATRVRFWMYLLIPLCALNWIGARLYQDSLETISTQPWITWLPRNAIIALLVIIIVETLLVLLFDFFYAYRRGIQVPRIIQSLVSGLVYFLVATMVMLSLFDAKIVAGILVGAVLLLFGIGHLMQEALGNIVAGFTLQVTRLYKPGDWLRIGAHEGQVEATDWRALTLRTGDGARVVVPMTQLSKVEVVNLSVAASERAETIDVLVSYAVPPEQVERALLESLADVPGISADPAPATQVLGFEPAGVRYRLTVWLIDYHQRAAVLSAVHRAVWYHFRRADIAFVPPVTAPAARSDTGVCDTGDRACLLRQVAFLSALTTTQIEQLAGRLSLQLFARGETICHQGEPGQTFYIIARGAARVTATDEAGQVIFTQVLNAGNFFGEFSLLTGEPRTATVAVEEETELLVVDKEDMRATLAANPQLAEHISGVLAERRHELQQHRERMPVAAGPAPAPETVDSLKRELLRKILDFFSY